LVRVHSNFVNQEHLAVMPVIYALVARGVDVLAEFSSTSGALQTSRRIVNDFSCCNSFSWLALTRAIFRQFLRGVSQGRALSRLMTNASCFCFASMRTNRCNSFFRIHFF
jgi:hypothetical protein